MDKTPTLAEVYRAVLRVEQLQLRTNGRVQELEVNAAHIEERLTVIERTHANCPLLRPEGLHTRSTDPDRDPITPLASPFSVRQMAIWVGIIGGGIWVAVDMLWKVGDWLRKLGVRP